MAWPALSLEQTNTALTAPGSPFEMDQAVIGGVALRVWKNAPPTLREVLLIARGFGDRPFLVHEDERVSFEAFYRAAVAMALRLQADGVQPGDRVAVIMRNLPEWPVAVFGAVLAGAIVAPLNAWWTAQELAFGLSDSGAKAAIFDAERFDRFRNAALHLPQLRLLYTARHAGAQGAARLEDILGRPAAWDALPDQAPPPVDLTPEGEAVIFYTSGTSGRPKGALATHRGITSSVMTALYAQARAYLRRGDPLPGPDPQAPQKGYLCGIPFFHVTGFCALLQVAMANGFKVVMMRRWDPALALGLIDRERLTHAGGVPTLAWQLLQEPGREAYDLSSLEVISYGGAPAAPELARQLHAAFPDTAAGFGWGMSETCAAFTLHLGEDYARRPASAGPSMPVGDLRIVGPEGQDLPVGEVGEILASGPNVVKGYWNNPEATAAAIQDGWLYTGDLGRLDEEGFLYIVDRAKDMIIRGGENIYCIEVENALFEHPAVADAALQAVPHQTLGEEPGAVVVLKPGAAATAEDLRAFVGQRLAAFKVPVKIVFSAEPLPRNANGKVLKTEIRRILLEA